MSEIAQQAIDTAVDAQQLAREANAVARAAIKQRDSAHAVLLECLEYFEDRQDVVDGDYGVPEANTEMRMAQAIREELGMSDNPYAGA